MIGTIVLGGEAAAERRADVHHLAVVPAHAHGRHAFRLSWEHFPGGGVLDFLPAGNQNQDYARSVYERDWDEFYTRYGGGQLFDAMREIASLVLSLSARVAEQMAWLADDDLTDERIEGQRFLLMCANEVWRAATLLRDAAECLGFAGEETAPGLDEGLLAYLTDHQEIDAFLWGLEWWITDGAH